MIAFFSVLLSLAKLSFTEAKLRFTLYRSLWCWLRPQGLPNVAADDAPWTVLGLSWGFGAVLGPSWGRLGPSWGRLGAILGRLGAIWGHLGAVLGLS